MSIREPESVAPPGLGSLNSVESVLAVVRQGGGRATTSRRVLLERLFAQGPHRTAEELAQEVQAVAPDVHISTIYRNLDELERLGVVTHAHLGHGAATYHLAAESHGHLSCESCGVTIEAPGSFFVPLATAARELFDFEIDARHFAVLGHCAACRQREDESGSLPVAP